ncbi:phytoene desaturase family protein [Niabella beijingensis]|uniref:phytoene desaturase family protein n=1 Tax=Niabella beijingensis TaxID=2872700 RepID=UPI001CBC540A|nr:NAD(P)/FAD-dependent oxidoreductase [Niabella beijingensis]MBZ4189389.1 NAD(P)/FAD-dependent oxidoreductase [Niabella beijingensis]
MHISSKSNYDVVVIGAGVGGLTAASLLSKAGLSVCVLEKEPHAGGYLAGFCRKGFRFDTAIHWLNQCATGGVVDMLFSILGSDYPKATTQKKVRRYIGANHNYLLTYNPDELKQQWISEFPEDREGIERFFKAAKKIGAAFNKYYRVFRTEESMSYWEKLKKTMAFARFGIAFIPYLRFSGPNGLQRGLNKFFKQKKLQDVFAADTELVGCLTPIGWAYYKDFQSPPEGGGQVIPEWLKHIVMYYKNNIFFNSTVQEIIVENELAKSVRFIHKGCKYLINTKYVIGAIDVETLYNKMLPPDTISSIFRNKLTQAELYSSSITISIGLDCAPDHLGFSEELLHLSSQNSKNIVSTKATPFLSEISIIAPSVRDPSLAPNGKGTLTIYVPAYMNDNEYWRTTTDVRGNHVRTEAYQRLKTEIAEAILQHVEDVIAPGLRSHILFYEVATPITHWRYTGNKNGTMMGAKPGRLNIKNKIAHYQTPVKNVLLGGHWAELGGGIPIAVKAGSNAALLVLKKENKKAFRALADYMDRKISITEFLKKNVFKPYCNNWVRKPTPAEKAIVNNKNQASL